ncbi:hypothetical protein CLU79DRAFT_837605 [Phycomyces nitens]|nr:hypothetical protein CLU79DRAFT_837605 [Phycomyces nitens]
MADNILAHLTSSPTSTSLPLPNPEQEKDLTVGDTEADSSSQRRSRRHSLQTCIQHAARLIKLRSELRSPISHTSLRSCRTSLRKQHWNAYNTKGGGEGGGEEEEEEEEELSSQLTHLSSLIRHSHSQSQYQPPLNYPPIHRARPSSHVVLPSLALLSNQLFSSQAREFKEDDINHDDGKTHKDNWTESDCESVITECSIQNLTTAFLVSMSPLAAAAATAAKTRRHQVHMGRHQKSRKECMSDQNKQAEALL